MALRRERSRSLVDDFLVLGAFLDLALRNFHHKRFLLQLPGSFRPLRILRLLQLLLILEQFRIEAHLARQVGLQAIDHAGHHFQGLAELFEGQESLLCVLGGVFFVGHGGALVQVEDAPATWAGAALLLVA